MEFYCWSGGESVWLMADGRVGGLEEWRGALSDLRRTSLADRKVSAQLTILKYR